jgi:DNA-binding response OmpR family regulator
MTRIPRILVIDDDPRLARFLQLNLEAEGYEAICARSGREGFEALLAKRPDGLILDLMLPDGDGLELCRRIRQFSDLPIIILTARGGEQDLVQGLDVGADDFIAKPFSREELLARLRAVLRRVGFSESVRRSPDLMAGDMQLICAERILVRDGRRVRLSHTEFRLLYFLMANPNRVLLTDELVARVWGDDLVGDTESLRTYVRYLRQKIERDPRNPERIVTERGLGYMFLP